MCFSIQQGGSIWQQTWPPTVNKKKKNWHEATLSETPHRKHKMVISKKGETWKRFIFILMSLRTFSGPRYRIWGPSRAERHNKQMWQRLEFKKRRKSWVNPRWLDWNWGINVNTWFIINIEMKWVLHTCVS
jgi:hypothetical protein